MLLLLHQTEKLNFPALLYAHSNAAYSPELFLWELGILVSRLVTCKDKIQVLSPFTFFIAMQHVRSWYTIGTWSLERCTSNSTYAAPLGNWKKHHTEQKKIINYWCTRSTELQTSCQVFTGPAHQTGHQTEVERNWLLPVKPHLATDETYEKEKRCVRLKYFNYHHEALKYKLNLVNSLVTSSIVNVISETG